MANDVALSEAKSPHQMLRQAHEPRLQGQARVFFHVQIGVDIPARQGRFAHAKILSCVHKRCSYRGG